MDSLETIFSIQKELASMMDLSRYPASIDGRVSALSTAIHPLIVRRQKKNLLTFGISLSKHP
jgi:hypothetical protein